ncbi:MAG: ABC transporter permease, partial [Phycisphaerales bacterium]|nr:ABC transporter permease [Phycisphaerales bacterium]
QLLRVRGIEGVEWAVPLYKGLIKARLSDGTFQNCNVIGLDDASMVGGPPRMVQGSLEDLRQADGVIVDEVGASSRLAHVQLDAAGKVISKRNLQVGDLLELNDRRAVVVGICSVQRTFQSQPVIYTTYTRATTFAPRERKLLSFICVKAKPGVSLAVLARRIETDTGLAALLGSEFSLKTMLYFMKYTGIPINFGIAVALGFAVGTAIAGQTFYQFTSDNIRQFGALKAMGATNLRLLGMIFLQAVVVGVIGYGLGVGIASSFAVIARKTELAFLLRWETLVGTGIAITLICIFASLLSIWKVMRLEPAIVFKG